MPISFLAQFTAATGESNNQEKVTMAAEKKARALLAGAASPQRHLAVNYINNPRHYAENFAVYAISQIDKGAPTDAELTTAMDNVFAHFSLGLEDL